MSKVEVIDPPALGTPNPLYSAITAVKPSPSSTLFMVAGQVALEPSTGVVPDELAAQVSLCLKRLDICLEHIGAKKTDITRLMYYIRQGAIDEHDAATGPGTALGVIVGIVGKWLEGHRPASCFTRVFGMSDDRYACEFEATVFLSEAKTVVSESRQPNIDRE